MAQNHNATAPAIAVNFPRFVDIFQAPNAPPVDPALAAPVNSPRRHDPPHQ